ncbi:MAG TPA: hypothetical protein VEN78_13790 [Bradyrhizobium sp.]|nr:hypothetical protein [Bradyrhizobium sp.]
MIADKCGWELVDGFGSVADYERLRDSLNEQLRLGQAEERRVSKPYSGLTTLNERWIKCKSTGDTWRLIAPDPPFPGIFEKVSA